MRFTDKERNAILYDPHADTADIIKACKERPDSEKIAIAAYNAKLTLRKQGIRADVVITQRKPKL